MTERFSKEEQINIAWKGSLTAFITLIIFSLLGSVIFNIFGITIEAFQIMGGILFINGRTPATPSEARQILSLNTI